MATSGNDLLDGEEAKERIMPNFRRSWNERTAGWGGVSHTGWLCKHYISARAGQPASGEVSGQIC